MLASLLIANPVSAFFRNSIHKDEEESISFWSQMGHNFSIECDENDPTIQKHIKWYLEHPKYLKNILKRSDIFIRYVYLQTQRKNLPAELALIPILESQYNPAIGSHSGPAGLWQMMPGTASKFGLKMNHTYDGRKDVSASTKAALSYLSYLHHYFKEDWLLAIAAYVEGEGKISSILHRRRLSFWQLPLNKGTKEYVPRLLAIASIIKQPENYNISLPKITNEHQLQEVIWNEAKLINLSEAAKDLGINNDTLRHYNPGIFKNVATVPESLTLLIPKDITQGNLQLDSIADSELEIPKTTIQSEQSKSTPSKKPKKKRSSSKKTPHHKAYKIRSGDTLSSIAKKFHLTVTKLKASNAITSDNKLKIGKVLKIP